MGTNVEGPKWTPGPWITDDRDPHDIARYVLAGSRVTPVVRVELIGDREAHEANAQLIAAAPDMYEALRACQAGEKGWGTKVDAALSLALNGPGKGEGKGE